MAGREVRRICQSAKLHCRAGSKGVDALRHLVTLCAPLGIAVDKTGHESSYHAGLSSRASRWQSSAWAAGMECALLAQRYLSRLARGCEADSRSCEIRLQLALSHRDRVLPGGDRLRIAARPEP